MHAQLTIALFVLCALAVSGGADAASRWTLMPDESIRWSVDAISSPHTDHIEMSGRRVSVIVRYGIDEHGELVLNRQIVWPMLRTIPNDTRGSLIHDFDIDAFPIIQVDGKPLTANKPTSFSIRGILTMKIDAGKGITITRKILPSTTKSAVIENCSITNNSGHTCTIDIADYDKTYHTDPAKGVYGEYILNAKCVGGKTLKLNSNRTAAFSMIFSGRRADQPPVDINPRTEEKARTEYINSIFNKLKFECPDKTLSREFDFAKVRAAESIYETKGGLMHGPGGGTYYAAIWANDQAEYANPFFPFLGDNTGNESALNSYRLFSRYMKPDYKPVPSSIIAEGTDVWNGAGDRGDAAMIAYGASRFALASGNRKIAEEMWPIITWCLEYCRRKTNADGVVESDCDELEGRFPAGKANLCTSSLTYDALRSAFFLGKELGKPQEEIQEYSHRAELLRAAIEKYFGADINNFHTYRYYDGNTTLRAWICIPLTMGIMDRKDGTVAALFSPKLWTDDGLATEAGKETFWDRATLYALRGVFAAGVTETAMNYLKYYSERRLLGEHVPYPVEAWPEGNQRHLSAESALYCRIITEGLFGIRPTGLHSFECVPHLPKSWNFMALRNVCAFGSKFDIVIKRSNDHLILDIEVGKQKTVHQLISPEHVAHIELPKHMFK